jgi:hypothetical protein
VWRAWSLAEPGTSPQPPAAEVATARVQPKEAAQPALAPAVPEPAAPAAQNPAAEPPVATVEPPPPPKAAEAAARATEDRARPAKAPEKEKMVAKVDKADRHEPPPPPPTSRTRAEPPPTPAPTTPALPAGLSPDAIQTALASARRSFEDCLKDPSVDPKTLETHQARLRFVVEPAGKVNSPEIDDATASEGPSGKCIRTAALALAFPAFRGDPVKVDTPIAVPTMPVIPAPDAVTGSLVAIQFTGLRTTRSRGEIRDTNYSEKPGDAAITDKHYADGVLTYVGQVGLGFNSNYAGIGFAADILPGGAPIDAARFKTLTVRLSSSTAKALRLRIIGPEESTRSNGCYPIAEVKVSPELKEYTIKLGSFYSESYCGSKGRSVKKTLSELTGFEVADIAVQSAPTAMSMGPITLNP